MPPTKFGVWHELRVIRERTGFSSADLAKHTVLQNGRPMSTGYLSDLENGKRWPNAKVVKALAVALEVPFTVLERPESDSIGDGAA